MPNLPRIFELVRFDFVNAFTSMRNTLFVIPYFLFWYLIFSNYSATTLEWLQSTQGLFIASWLLEDQELALQLLVDRSPTLSVYLLISVVIMPLFIMFAANNQFSSDRARGAFRFILTRATRHELYLSRFLSSLLVAASCIVIATAWAFIVAWLNAEAQALRLIVFALETLLLLLFYCMPFVAFMSMTSALAKSAMGNLFLALMLYTFLVFVVLWLHKDLAAIAYLLPSAIRPFLFEINNTHILTAIVALSLYALSYYILGWFIFKNRDV